MKRSWLVISILAVVAAPACSDSSKGTNNIAPGAQVGSEYDVSTSLDPAAIAAGETSTATCTVLDRGGNPVDTPTTVTVVPMDGITIDGRAVTGVAAGTFTVSCRAPDLGPGAVDSVGAELTVSAGAAASITAVLGKETIQPNETTTVDCVAADAYGNAVEAVETTVSASPEGATINDHSISAVIAGSYDVTCAAASLPDAASIPAVLTVATGEVLSVELVAEPEKDAYQRGNIVTLVWYGLDEWNNRIEGLAGTLVAPGTGGVEAIDVAANKYRLLEQGEHTFSVTLDAPHAGLSDDVTLLVDDTGPVITLLSPARGEQILQGTPDEVVVVSFTVTDAYSEVDGVVINGKVPAQDADGTYSFGVSPEWGTNLVSINATDLHGNASKLTPSFQYGANFTSFVETDAQGVKTNDGAVALIGQDVLDDGIHDPADVDDLATILEVVLTEIDLPALLEAQGGIFETTIPVADYDLGAGVTLKSDVIVTVNLVPPSDIGPTSVSLDSVPGGIDTHLEFGTFEEDGLTLALELDLNVPATISIPVLGDFDVAAAGGTVNTTARARKLTVDAKIVLDLPPGGTLDSGIENLNLQILDLEIDPFQSVPLTFEIPLIGQSWTLELNDLIPINDLVTALIDPLLAGFGPILTDLLEPQIEQFATDAIEGLLGQLEFTTTFGLPAIFGEGQDPVEVEIYTNLTSAEFTNDGGAIGLSLGAYAPKGMDHEPRGALVRNGCLTGEDESFVYDWAREMGLALKTDALNSVLFAVFWSGYLDGPVDVGALLEGSSVPIPIDGLMMTLNPYAAPVINDCDKLQGAVEMELGDLRAVIQGNLLGLDIDATTFIDLKLLVSFSASPEGLMINISELREWDVEVIEVAGDDKDVKGLLEDELGSILEGFLVGESFGPIAIPEIDLSGLAGEGVLPPGITLTLQELEVTKDSGYVLVEGELD